jgi:hypothetical protein
MDSRAFDGLARRLGRRNALQALGIAAVATASGFTLADAREGKNNRKKNKRQKKKLEKQALALCEGQVQECNTLIAGQCNGDPDCLASGQQCCQFLATCDFAGLIACLQT